MRNWKLTLSDYLKAIVVLPVVNGVSSCFRLYMSFPLASPDREQFKMEAVQWSAQSDQHPKGHPRLHQLLAHALWTAKRFGYT